MARIVTVYTRYRHPFSPRDMSLIRWLAMSAALARRGHEVDIATREPGLLRRFVPTAMAPRLRRVPLDRVRWDRYDVVKTEFHLGFETLEAHGGSNHPFIIAKLGSLVDARDRPEIYFTGRYRRALWATQERIARRARLVTLLSEPSVRLWRERFGDTRGPLLVPGAAARELPPPGPDPYPPDAPRRCLFAGNLYNTTTQPRPHATLVAKLGALGRRLDKRGIRLFAIGTGDHRPLDRRAVTHLGPVDYHRSWDYLRHAQVGLVLALGPTPNDNESTKIYAYLRVGLPTVCEDGFPNQRLIEQARLGEITPNGNIDALAGAVERAVSAAWDRQRAIDLVLGAHTWDHRARLYDRVLGLTEGPA